MIQITITVIYAKYLVSSMSVPSVWSLWNWPANKNLVVAWSETGTLQLNTFSSNTLRMMMMVMNVRKIKANIRKAKKVKKITFPSEIFGEKSG